MYLPVFVCAELLRIVHVHLQQVLVKAVISPIPATQAIDNQATVDVNVTAH